MGYSTVTTRKHRITAISLQSLAVYNTMLSSYVIDVTGLWRHWPEIVRDWPVPVPRSLHRPCRYWCSSQPGCQKASACYGSTQSPLTSPWPLLQTLPDAPHPAHDNKWLSGNRRWKQTDPASNAIRMWARRVVGKMYLIHHSWGIVQSIYALPSRCRVSWLLRASRSWVCSRNTKGGGERHHPASPTNAESLVSRKVPHGPGRQLENFSIRKNGNIMIST